MSLRFPIDEDVLHHLERLSARRDKKARQRRVLAALDKYVPRWEELINSGEILSWFLHENPQTGRTQGKLFAEFCDQSDEANLVVFLELFRAWYEGRSNHKLGEPLGSAGVRRGDVLHGRYEVIDLLGVGGFAEVYLVCGTATAGGAGYYALKRLRTGALTAQDRSDFEDEARLLMSLPEHPNLLTAHFLEKAQDVVYIVSELVLPDEHGRVTLGDHVRSGPLSLEQQLRWAIQCCDGLLSAYAHGIRAHRDIKPANILVDRDRRVRIADFGLTSLAPSALSGEGLGAALLDAPKRRMAQVQGDETSGSPAYMAPEQFGGAADCDVRSDIYSFGITLYEMASRGRLPFSPEQTGALLGAVGASPFAAMAVLHRTAPLRPLDSPLFPIIATCCAKLPSQRYASMEALRGALLQVASSLGISVQEPSTQELSDMELAGRAHNQGAAHARLGEHEQAVVMFQKALSLFNLMPSSFDAGLSLMALKRYPEALAAFEKDHQGERAELHLQLGACKAHVQGWESALPHYEAVARSEPAMALAWENMFYGYQATGQMDRAETALVKLSTLEPNRPEWLLHKAELYARTGRPGQAHSSLATLKVDGLSEEQRARLGKLRLRLQQEAVFSRAKALLGAGYSHERLRLACDTALDAVSAPVGRTQDRFVEALRSVEPAILHSKAEELFRHVFGVR